MSLRLLDYDKAKNAVILTILGSKYRVPMIMGERGVGKSAMVQDIARELHANLITIDANVLKEGEIGGLPMIYNGSSSIINKDALLAALTRLVKNYEDDDYNLQSSIINGIKKYVLEEKAVKKDSTDSIVVYAPHVKLQEARRYYEEDKKSMTIIFIDEFNRCDTIVKREIMNIILNREINGYKLPKNTKIICACNPTSNFDLYTDTDYQVEEMDEAQLDRFRWIAVGSNVNTWIKWGMSINPDTKKSYIDEKVIEFIMDRDTYLNNISSSKEDVKTSPRSWEFVSDTYRTYTHLNKDQYKMSTNDLLNAIAGDVGLNIASDFVTFLNDNSNPLLKPKEVFDLKKGKMTDTVIKTIQHESLLRKNVLVHNCTQYVKDKWLATEGKESDTYTAIEAAYIELITHTINNNDLMYSTLLDLKLSKNDEDGEFLKHILDLKNIDILNAYTKLNQSF